MKTGIIFSVVLLFGLMLALPGCTQTGYERPSNDKIEVFVSILPQAEFVEAIGGEHVNVHVMIPPGASPATYDPSPSSLAKLSEADVYFRIGYIPFEKAHMKAIESVNPSMKIVDTSNGINLRYEENGGVDPHIWLSPKLVEKQVEIIARTLKDLNPDNAGEYEKNKDAYILRLEKLHEDIADATSSMKIRKFIVFHPSWGYFADEFNLEQISIEVDGKEPTASKLKELVNIAKDEGIHVIFYEPQFSKESAETIAKEIGGKVVPIDPLPENYIRRMKNIANIFSGTFNET
ncbi:MAG: zinc ABC transporter solute-binding protein [Candidatus Micrarchaeota archaeon]|nr:zinc ABC transporter solute-binding protein [Candidatus Micrarchaeota archaeon]